MTDTAAPPVASKFRTGSEEAEEAGKGAAYPRTEYLTLEDGERAIIRWLYDAAPNPSLPHVQAWRVVEQHSMVPTKPKPSDFPGDKWPSTMGSVCRKTKLADKVTTLYPDCAICDKLVPAAADAEKRKKLSPSGRTWSVGCLREEVKATEEDVKAGYATFVGQIIGFRDKTREVAKIGPDGKPTGEVTVEKDIVIVNQGWKNFFSALQGFASTHGTLLDRDYVIIRKGTGTSTGYQIVALDPIPAQKRDANGNPVGDPVRFDLRDPEFMARYDVPDVDAIIEEQASDDYYAKFFDPDKHFAWKKSESSDNGQQATPQGAPVEQQAKPSGDMDADQAGRLAALADRVKGGNEQQAQQPPAEQAPAEQPPAEQPAAEQPAPAQEQQAAPQPAATGGMRDFS